MTYYEGLIDEHAGRQSPGQTEWFAACERVLFALNPGLVTVRCLQPKPFKSATRSGDAVVNDCAIHPLFSELPFGGVGNSGMGKYHGRWGFEAFTNARGVLHHSSRVDPGVRYPPYAKHGLERTVVNKLMP